MSGRWRRCGDGWRKRHDRTDVGTFKQYVDMLPKYLTRRFISAKQDAVVVSGRGCPTTTPASCFRSSTSSIDKYAAPCARNIPATHIAVTGLSVIAARNSALMIDKLSRGLTSRSSLSRPSSALAFRSPRRDAGQPSCPAFSPSCWPARCYGATGQGLQFASVDRA